MSYLQAKPESHIRGTSPGSLCPFEHLLQYARCVTSAWNLPAKHNREDI